MPLLGVLVLAVGLAIAGCGDGDSSETTTITKAQFTAKADAACAKLRRQARTDLFAFLKSGSGEPKDPDAKAAYQAELGRRFVIALKQRELEEFRALGLPSDDGGEAKMLIAAFERGIRKAEQDPAQAAQDSTASLGEAEEVAAKYGLTGC